MNIPSTVRAAEQLSAAQRDLLTRLLEQMLALGGGVPALKFRADHYSDVDALEELESNRWLKRENDHYIVQSIALPLLDTEPARRLLSNIERVYAVLKAQYRQTQQAQVPVSSVAVQTQLPVEDVTAALRVMLDASIWYAGWSTDLHKEDAFVCPSENVSGSSRPRLCENAWRRDPRATKRATPTDSLALWRLLRLR